MTQTSSGWAVEVEGKLKQLGAGVFLISGWILSPQQAPSLLRLTSGLASAVCQTTPL